MTTYWAVFIDETGHGEFGAGIEADSKAEAYEIAREDYPESRLVQLESPEDTAKRERDMYERIRREIDGDDFFDDLNEWEDEEDDE